MENSRNWTRACTHTSRQVLLITIGKCSSVAKLCILWMIEACFMPCWYEWNNARNESKSGSQARAFKKKANNESFSRVIYFCCRRFFHPIAVVACNVCCCRASLKAPNTLIISSWWRLTTVIEILLKDTTHWQHILFYLIVSSLLELSKKLNACDYVEEFSPVKSTIQIADLIQAWRYSNKFNSLFFVSRSSINFRWWKFFNFLFFLSLK